MNRTQRLLWVLVLLAGGLLPISVYWIEHGGPGTPAFSEYQTMSLVQQAAQVTAGLIVKPVYMLISLLGILGLLGQTAPDVAAVRWGLSAFLIGEIFCGINFIVYRHASIPSEYVHSYGMVLAFGFIAYAVIEILDRRLLHVSDGRCAGGELCRTCKRASPLQCAARRMAMLTVFMAGILSLLPLTAVAAPESYQTGLFGFPYSYARFEFYEWYETRLLPVAALICFAVALFRMLKAKGEAIPQWTKIFFSAGVGTLGFSLFRLILASIFVRDLIWYEFWEEVTELMFTSALAFVLWQFRDTLLEKTPALEAILRIHA